MPKERNMKNNWRSLSVCRTTLNWLTFFSSFPAQIMISSIKTITNKFKYCSSNPWKLQEHWLVQMTKPQIHNDHVKIWRLFSLTIYNSELMITRSEVYVWKITNTMKLVKQVINTGNGIFILNCDLVQLPIVDAHLERTIFLLHEQYWCTLWRNTRSIEALI